ncbi:MAG TPA: DUF2393 family protein [Acidobacteriaceae bacterium]|nr:DUF2393 family protein [Acidobacteriaceae bacterium]
MLREISAVERFPRRRVQFRLMTAPDPTSKIPAPAPAQDDVILSLHREEEPRSWMPWIAASTFVLLVLAAIFLLSRHSGPVVPGGTGMAPAAPYAASLPVSNLEMSEATSFSGSKVTYIDGQITNTGNQTITGITAQVGFRNDLGQLALRAVTPVTWIRTREPYVDTEPVAAAPLKPGDHQDFRLIFDNVPLDWNQQVPEIRMIEIRGR